MRDDIKKCPICIKDIENYSGLKNHEHKVQIHDMEYTYSPYSDLLRLDHEKYDQSIVSSVRCARCHNDSFKISYGDYECIANCNCGHSFVIYDG